MYELFELKQSGSLSMPIIETLQSWGLIANFNTLKCNKGYFLLNCQWLDYTNLTCLCIIAYFAIVFFFI